MALVIKRPSPNSERLSWCNGIEVEACVEDGKAEGTIDCQFAILPITELEHTLHGEDQDKVHEFLAKRLRAVRGFKDDDGKEWPTVEQVDFVTLSPDLIGTVFRAYFEHTKSGNHRKKDSASSPAKSTDQETGQQKAA